jgi:hypothetical protein
MGLQIIVLVMSGLLAYLKVPQLSNLLIDDSEPTMCYAVSEML